MLTKKIKASLEVKEVIEDKDKIAELDEVREKVLNIDGEGNVGIGTTALSEKMSV